MLFYLIILTITVIILEARHFDGGTINWAPINPYDNSSSVGITITQSYYWAYPTITCANNVPITTSGRSTQNWNLTCVVDCTTDGGYSTKPINILTDCTSSSSSLGMMTSSRSHNLTLTAGSYFYLANDGSAWVALNYPTESGLQWSIVTFIDLRLRPDGFMNTPPVASVISPQYAIVNRTIQINIPVSDVNAGDDVRCRWSTYTPGYRRRRWIQELYKSPIDQEKLIRRRIKRNYCYTNCNSGDNCNSNDCKNINACSGSTCQQSCCYDPPCSCSSGNNCGYNNCNNADSCNTSHCQLTCCDNGYFSTVATTIATTVSTTVATTIATTVSTTVATTIATTVSTTVATTIATTVSTTVATTIATTVGTTVSTTTIDTPGTLASTSSFVHRQAIDECGGICYPGSVPNGTSLSNCTITFTGTRVGVWYAVAIQVEDFINNTSTTPMSSTPVQLLIYVLPTPVCYNPPIILPVNGCLEVQVGVQINFNIYAMNECNSSVSNVTDILVSSAANGMIDGNLTSSPTNSSLSYLPFTWAPQTNQIGSQQLCVIAYTTEQVQSTQYCVTFTVKATSNLCVTTITTTTTTTSTTTTTTSRTTTTTTSTTTSATTTTTTQTTTTSSTSTSTTSSTSSTSTSSTSTSSTSTSTSSTSTSTTTSSTSTSSTSTSTTSTTSSTSTSTTSTSSTSTSTTSTSTTTSTSSTSTSSTSSTSTTSTTTTTTTTSTTTTTTSTTSTTSTTTTTTSVTTTTVTTATTRTTKAPKKSTNWLLILGLSLLALLLAICCACCCLYCFLWGPGARRRRRRKEENDDVGEKTFLPRNMVDLTRKQSAIDRMDRSTTSSTDHMLDNRLHVEDSIIGKSPTDLYVRLSDSATVMTDAEESRISSTISIKKLKQSDIRHMNNIQKVNETKKVDIKSANEGDSNGNNSATQQPIITVVRVKKGSNIDGINTSSLNTAQQENLNVTSTERKRTGEIHVTKLPRTKSTETQRPRVTSISSVIPVPKSSIEMQSIGTQRPRVTSISSVIHVPKSSIRMQSTVKRSKSSLPTIDTRVKTSSRVTVIKLPRNLSTLKSDGT